ncbi:DMT family transporter [Alishewanella longhuensis]
MTGKLPAMRLALLTFLALLAFAGNSLLCRVALAHTTIDAASFTTVRLVSGALVLWLLARLHYAKTAAVGQGNWLSALALFAYAAGFSFAYTQLDTGMGALILFGAVQATMIGYGIWRGERLTLWQWLGLGLALSGLAVLLWPGDAGASLPAALLMLAAGMAWGLYSLRGKGAGHPLQVTAGNFVLAVPMALLLSLVFFANARFDVIGLSYALLSGILTSGVGYAIWYSVLPQLTASSAATLQLSVPLLAAVAGILLLQEPVTVRLVLAALAICCGITLVIFAKGRAT